MDPYESYQLYQAIKLHFESDSYDAVKYNFKTKVKPQSYYKRRDKYFFAKLARKYPKHDQMVEALVANFIAGKQWVGDVASDMDAEYNLQSWKKVTESLTYNFRMDLSKMDADDLDTLLKVVEGQHPPILKYLQREDIHITTVVILDQLTGFMDHANKRISETIVWPELYKRVKKTSSFVRVDLQKYKDVVLDILAP